MQSGENRIQPQETQESLRTFYSSNRHSSIKEGINQQIEPQEPSDSFTRFNIIHAKHKDSAHPQFSGNSLNTHGKQRMKIQSTKEMIEKEALMVLTGGKKIPQNRKHISQKSTIFQNKKQKSKKSVYNGALAVESKGVKDQLSFYGEYSGSCI
jgi:hypothetical protein